MLSLLWLWQENAQNEQTRLNKETNHSKEKKQLITSTSFEKFVRNAYREPISLAKTMHSFIMSQMKTLPQL